MPDETRIRRAEGGRWTSARRGLWLVLPMVVAGLAVWTSLRGMSAPIVGPRWELPVRTAEIRGTSDAPTAQSVFEVRNVGDADLILGESTSSCECSVAEIEPRVVRPGHSGRILVSARPPPFGTRDVRLSITTNDMGRPHLELVLKLTGTAEVPYVGVSEEAVRFIEPTPGSRLEAIRVETREPVSKEPWIQRAESRAPYLRIEGGCVREKDLGGTLLRVYEYTITLAPPLPDPGEFLSSVVLLPQGRSSAPVHEIKVSGRMTPSVFTVPARIFASYDADGERPRVTFVVQSRSNGVPLEVNISPTLDPRLSVRLEERLDDGRLRFTASPASDVSELIDAEIPLDTNHPDKPSLRVPIRFAPLSSR